MAAQLEAQRKIDTYYNYGAKRYLSIKASSEKEKLSIYLEVFDELNQGEYYLKLDSELVRFLEALTNAKLQFDDNVKLANENGFSFSSDLISTEFPDLDVYKYDKGLSKMKYLERVRLKAFFAVKKIGSYEFGLGGLSNLSKTQGFSIVLSNSLEIEMLHNKLTPELILLKLNGN